MENYLLFLLIKNLNKILSRGDFGIIIIHLFDDVLRKAIVVGETPRSRVNGIYDFEYAKSIIQVCIYHGLYYRATMMLLSSIRSMPSQYSLYNLLRAELALVKQKTQHKRHSTLRYHLYNR